MADSFSDKVQKAGQKLGEAATQVGHRVGEAVEKAADWTKEKAHEVGNRVDEMSQKAEHAAQRTFGETGAAGTVADIREHMDVIGSCGNPLGKVDHVEGDTIKLTKADSPDGLHHLIPTAWVSRVDSHVHLSKDCAEARAAWQTA